MSNFICEHCGTYLIDTPGGGYITECEHYTKEPPAKLDEKIDALISFVDEEKIKQAAKEGALSQRIQVMVWDYMQLPKLERNGVELANAIIEDCKKTL